MKSLQTIFIILAIAMCSCSNDDVAMYQDLPGKLLWADGSHVDAITQVDPNVVLEMLQSQSWEQNNKSVFYFDRNHLEYLGKDDKYIQNRSYMLFTSDGKCYNHHRDISLDEHTGALEFTYKLEGNVLSIIDTHEYPIWSDTQIHKLFVYEVVGYTADKKTLFLNDLRIKAENFFVPQGWDKATTQCRIIWGELPQSSNLNLK